MDAQKELLERWAGWQRSIEQRDVEAARGFLADDYALELMHPDRAVFPRDQWLETLREYVVTAYGVEEQIVDVSGDLAVVMHRARMQATVFGADRSGTFVITDVWLRRAGAWKVWRRHSTPLAPLPMPAKKRG